MDFFTNRRLMALVDSCTRGSIPDLIKIIDLITAELEATDGLRFFLALYREVLQAFQEAIAGQCFQDPDWVVELNVELFQIFLDQLFVLHGRRRSWQAFMIRCERLSLSRVRIALVGARPHICVDLVLALAKTTATPTRRLPRPGTPRAQDFELMSLLIAGTQISVVQKLSPGLASLFRFLARVGKPTNEHFILWLRGVSWQQADRYLAADQDDRKTFVNRLDWATEPLKLLIAEPFRDY